MQKLVEIGRFDNPVEAHILLDLLTDADIPARIFDEHAGSALPHVGAIGVRVVVRAEDAQRAAAVMAEEKSRDHAPTRQDVEEMDWRGTGEADGGERFAAGEDEIEDTDDDEGAGDATAPVGKRSDSPGLEDHELVAWAQRTRTLALLGLAILPFAFGALFRSTRPPRGIETSELASRLVRQARWIAYLTILVFMGFCALILFPPSSEP